MTGCHPLLIYLLVTHLCTVMNSPSTWQCFQGFTQHVQIQYISSWEKKEGEKREEAVVSFFWYTPYKCINVHWTFKHKENRVQWVQPFNNILTMQLKPVNLIILNQGPLSNFFSGPLTSFCSLHQSLTFSSSKVLTRHTACTVSIDFIFKPVWFPCLCFIGLNVYKFNVEMRFQ